MPGRTDSRRRLPMLPGIQLSACPFCASSDVEFYEHIYSKQFAAMCNACGAEGPCRQDYREAGQLWNRRAPG